MLYSVITMKCLFCGRDFINKSNGLNNVLVFFTDDWNLFEKNNIASSETFTLPDHPNYFPSDKDLDILKETPRSSEVRTNCLLSYIIWIGPVWLSLHTKGSIPKWVFKERFLWHRTRNLSILLVNCDRIGSLRADKLCGVFCLKSNYWIDLLRAAAPRQETDKIAMQRLRNQNVKNAY